MVLACESEMFCIPFRTRAIDAGLKPTRAANAAAVSGELLRKSLRVMGCMLHQVKQEVNARVSCGGIPPLPLMQHTWRMERETHRYLRLWREKRGYTQDQVVDRLVIHEDDKLPKSKAQLSKVENGKSPYNQRLVEALAEIYDCEVWELLGRDPTKEGEVLDMLRPLDERTRQRVAAYIAGLTEGAQAK